MTKGNQSQLPPQKTSTRLMHRLHRRGWLSPLCGGALGQTAGTFEFTSIIAQVIILLFSTFWTNIVGELVTRFFFGHT